MTKGIFLFWGLIIISACATHNRERALEDINPSAKTSLLEEQFTTQEIDEESLRAFEVKAIQKVEELYGYIAIMTDTVYEATFRDQALELSLSLFESRGKTKMNRLVSNAGTIEDYLVQIRNQDRLLQRDVVKVLVKEPLTAQSLQIYSGLLTVTLGNERNGISYSQGFNLSRQAKLFGDEEKVIWEVRLTSMEEIAEGN